MNTNEIVYAALNSVFSDVARKAATDAVAQIDVEDALLEVFPGLESDVLGEFAESAERMKSGRINVYVAFPHDEEDFGDILEAEKF